MPGFFDKVAQGIKDTADGVSKAITDATAKPDGAAGAPGAPGAPPAPPAPSPTGYVFAGPTEWITDAQVATALAVPGLSPTFGPATTYSSDEGLTARWTSTDGQVTVDVLAYSEDFLVRCGGQPQLIDAQLPTFAGEVWQSEDDVYEIGWFGVARPGHGGYLGAAGDMAIKVDVYGPEGPELEAAAFNVARTCVED